MTDAATRRLVYVDALIALYKTLADLDAAGIRVGVRVAELTDGQRAALAAYDEARRAYLTASSGFSA